MRTVVGTVVSDKMQKTISVREDRMVKHPKYGKYIRRKSIYKAHDERGDAREGDIVEIVEARRISKNKHWRLLRVVRRGNADLGRVEGREDVIAATTVRRAPAAAPAPTADEGQEEAGA